MKDKKYILTEETIEIYGHTLHRIKATRAFINVKIGDLGGWIESEDNLSHDGDCWVYENAKIFEGAIVHENATVSEDAMVYGAATIFGNALIIEHAIVYGNAEVLENAMLRECAEVTGNAVVCGDAVISENATIFGNAMVRENACVFGSASIYGWANISGNATIDGNAHVSGNAKVHGEAIVSGNAKIRKNLDIFSATDILVVGPIGSRNDYTTFARSKGDGIFVFCGCFDGKLSDFEKAVLETHGDSEHGKKYLLAIEFARSIFK